jgi:hypothetical protein
MQIDGEAIDETLSRRTKNLDSTKNNIEFFWGCNDEVLK